MEFVCPKCGSHYFSVVDGAVRCNGDSSEGPRTCDFSIPTEEQIRNTAEHVGRAIARDVIAENLDRQWTGLDIQDGDHFLKIGLDNTMPEWDRAEEIARDSYFRALDSICPT